MIPETVRHFAIHATPEPEYESVPCLGTYVRRETGPGSLLGVQRDRPRVPVRGWIEGINCSRVQDHQAPVFSATFAPLSIGAGPERLKSVCTGSGAGSDPYRVANKLHIFPLSWKFFGPGFRGHIGRHGAKAGFGARSGPSDLEIEVRDAD